MSPRHLLTAGLCRVRLAANLAGASINAVKRGVRDPEQAGWLETEQVNQLASIHVVLRNPPAERAAAELAAVQRRLAKQGPFGETLMRAYLTLLVDSPRFEDEAKPAFLVNPWTNEQLRPDRYYAEEIFFETGRNTTALRPSSPRPPGTSPCNGRGIA